MSIYFVVYFLYLKLTQHVAHEMTGKASDVPKRNQFESLCETLELALQMIRCVHVTVAFLYNAWQMFSRGEMMKSFGQKYNILHHTKSAPFESADNNTT